MIDILLVFCSNIIKSTGGNTMSHEFTNSSFLPINKQIEETGSAHAKQLYAAMIDAAARYVACSKRACNVRQRSHEESGVSTLDEIRAPMYAELCISRANDLRSMHYQLPYIASSHDFCHWLVKLECPEIDFSLTEPVEAVV
ncbi:hypothetical protein KKG46_06095 [Patescibacteria group bacterium]|nr:hypothetical protein [Patescibacteria group bacterium]